MKGYIHHQQVSACNRLRILHIVIIPADREREAALNFGVRGLRIRVLQGASCQHGFLRVIESDGEEFVPVADQVFLHNYLMKC